MMRRVLLAGVFLVLTTACGFQAASRDNPRQPDRAVVDTRDADTEGWRITIHDASGASVGNLDLRMTKERGHSCLGDFEGRQPRLARVTRSTLDTSKIRLHGDTVAVWRRGSSLWIDLASPCDAYTLLEGVVNAEGVASGDVVAFGPRGGQTTGTFTTELLRD